jgi:hypothetical protein
VGLCPLGHTIRGKVYGDINRELDAAKAAKCKLKEAKNKMMRGNSED